MAHYPLAALEEHLPVFHGEKDFYAGCSHAVNRKGELETFGLLSISIGIVNTFLTPVTSYAQLASITTEVKKAAIKTAGFIGGCQSQESRGSLMQRME